MPSKQSSALSREERDLLIKIDSNLSNLTERFTNFQDRMSLRVESLEKNKAERADLTDMKNAITSTIETTFQNSDGRIDGLVSKDEFIPVKNLVYGASAIILIEVVTAIVGLVIWKANK